MALAAVRINAVAAACGLSSSVVQNQPAGPNKFDTPQLDPTILIAWLYSISYVIQYKPNFFYIPEAPAKFPVYCTVAEPKHLATVLRVSLE